MLAACYNFALEAALSPAAESLVTRFRAVLLSGLTFGLGAVATGGLRLMDSRYALAGAVGSAAVLGVALVVETVRRAEERHVRAEVAELRRSFTAMRAHMTEIEVIMMAMKSSADVALRRSYPDLGGTGADGTGRQRPL